MTWRGCALPGAFGCAALLALAACDSKSSASKDAGSTVATASASVRTERLACGHGDPCPPGESCYYDAPGCEDVKGFCGPPEAKCVHSTSFCGCGVIDLACEWPKNHWTQKGPACFTEGAFGVKAAGDAGSDARADGSR